MITFRLAAVVCLLGDRIHVTTAALTVNGETVKDVPPALLAGFAEALDQVIRLGTIS